MAKILVVDDEEHIVMILKDSLEFSGFQVVTAYNGLEAIEQVEKNNPDLIVLDIGMPKLDGWEVCRSKPEDALRNDRGTIRDRLHLIDVRQVFDDDAEICGNRAGHHEGNSINRNR